ncbi:hypothetical protein [Arthrobacter sp. MMS18-M83]|uniref:hypothetical protein n=1 Tax=Arthrobacter sp. MMS18-M83 TaxID=2996261 RepID=UPI00227CDBE5|nr:hypothetical protein [Arthrobacter sp. MMS18-M83]WAH98584.1 hypothetical protein OW521_06970 [Arthrobacter sp. MMS18-M83]
MKLKVLIALGCTLALTAVAIYSYFEADGYRNLISFAVVAFWLAIAAGITVKLIRARRGHKIREAFSPVAGAADTYQSLLLGKPTMAESAEEAAQHTTTGKFPTGP